MKRAPIPPFELPDSFATLPGWATQKSTHTNLEMRVGAALAVLHPVMTQPGDLVPLALLRDRRALAAALTCLKLIGRHESEEGLRDAVFLLRPGDDPGPGGAVFVQWRAAAQAEIGPRSLSSILSLLPRDLADAAQGWLRDAATLDPVRGAASLLEQGLKEFPRQELGVLMLSDACLARSFGWASVLPLLGAGLSSRDLKLGGDDLARACQRALLDQITLVLHEARVLARRAYALCSVAPKLRAKASDAALDLILKNDAICPSLDFAPMVRGSTAKMSDRAARRLCDRLVDLGALRELTGRPSFRLYGL